LGGRHFDSKHIGGKIILSDGQFNLNGQITLSSHITILGQGLGVTVLRLVDNSRPFELGVSLRGTLRGKNITNMTISGLTLNGNSQNNNSTGVMKYGKDGSNFIIILGFYCEVCSSILLNYTQYINFPGHGYD
jgi:hypothetical protein